MDNDNNKGLFTEPGHELTDDSEDVYGFSSQDNPYSSKSAGGTDGRGHCLGHR